MSRSPAGSPSPSQLLRSEAFCAAALRSERHRVYALIAVIALVVLPVALISATRVTEARIKFVAALAGAFLLVVQCASLVVVRWAQRRDRAIPSWWNVATVTVESSVPAAVMLSHIQLGTLAPYAALSSPPLLGFPLLIGLTTLRLRPRLCILAGVVSAVGYGLLVAFVASHGEGRQTTTGIPFAGYVVTPFLLLTCGIASAWVAREIRGHVEAALGEAETKRQMERIEQDLAVARSIQQALLPREAPDIAGYEIAGWNRPADQTGGDYYDWERLPDGNWIVTLADVCGHGIGPALVTAACRAYVRASAAHHADLGSLATRVNALLAADLPEGRFVTMVNVLIDTHDGGGGPIAILSAGHGPIVVYVHATGAVNEVAPSDLPLAVAPDVRFGPAETLTMEPGDVLALVTDGFVEWSRAAPHERRDDFGTDRLRESIARHAHRPAAAIIQAVAADVAAFAGPQPQQDDLTMVVIKRTAGL